MKLVRENINEVNFERGLDPKKAMNIGTRQQILRDLEHAGLNEDDVALINEQSLSTFNTITNRLNYLRVIRADAEVRINTNQKIINEANQNIAALMVMIQTAGVTDSDVQDLLAKLRARKAIAEVALQQAVLDANASAAEATIELQRLRDIGMVLK